MKNALLFLLVCLLPLEVFGRQEAGSRQAALVFTHVTVIDATGAPAKPDMTVVVRGDRIEALGKTGKLTVPQNAQVVNAKDKNGYTPLDAGLGLRLSSFFGRRVERVGTFKTISNKEKVLSDRIK